VDPESLQDLFQELGSVRCRRMFGGLGLYSGERMFAIEAKGAIFIKADAETRAAFEDAGSRPFTYDKDGKPVSMSYWSLPDQALDDPAEAARWARLGLEAALRAGGKDAKKRKR
jgi:DNA transformation protein